MQSTTFEFFLDKRDMGVRSCISSDRGRFSVSSNYCPCTGSIYPNWTFVQSNDNVRFSLIYYPPDRNNQTEPAVVHLQILKKKGWVDVPVEWKLKTLTTRINNGSVEYSFVSETGKSFLNVTDKKEDDEKEDDEEQTFSNCKIDF